MAINCQKYKGIKIAVKQLPASRQANKGILNFKKKSVVAKSTDFFMLIKLIFLIKQPHLNSMVHLF